MAISNLTEASLEQALLKCCAHSNRSGQRLFISPTKLYMFQYPNESSEEFKIRFQQAQKIVKKTSQK